MFRNPAVAVLLVQNVLFGIVYYSQLYYLPLFFQNALQLSPLVSAALLLPIPAGQMTFSIASGQFISRFERYNIVIWAGFSLWTLGAALTTLFTRSFPIAGMAVILACQGAGVGFVSVSQRRRTIASNINEQNAGFPTHFGGSPSTLLKSSKSSRHKQPELSAQCRRCRWPSCFGSTVAEPTEGCFAEWFRVFGSVDIQHTKLQRSLACARTGDFGCLRKR